MEKRQLIFENNELLKTILSDLNQFLPALGELKQAYENLEVGDFDDAVFTELKSGINSTLKRYNENLEKQLDQSGVKNSKLRAIVLTGSEEPSANLRTAFNKLLSVYVNTNPNLPFRAKVLDLSDICYNDGRFQVGNIEEIKEKYCMVYLNDSEDKDIYKVLQDTKKALDLFAIMAKIRGFSFGIHGSGLDQFFDLVDGKLIIKPYSIDDAKTFLPKQQALHDAEIKRQQKQSAIIRQNNLKAGFAI